MTLLLMAALQTTSPAMSERIDLTIPQPCVSPNANDGEVVVCANPNGQSPYRLNQPVQPARKALPSAQAQVAKGVSVAAETEQADVGGFASNRAMVRLKIKF